MLSIVQQLTTIYFHPYDKRGHQGQVNMKPEKNGRQSPDNVFIYVFNEKIKMILIFYWDVSPWVKLTIF